MIYTTVRVCVGNRIYFEGQGHLPALLRAIAETFEQFGAPSGKLEFSVEPLGDPAMRPPAREPAPVCTGCGHPPHLRGKCRGGAQNLGLEECPCLWDRHSRG